MKKFKILHHVDQETIERMYNEYSPIFILSTGRSGSKFIYTLLSQSNELQSYHEAFPNLQYFSNYAYQNQSKRDVLIKMIEAARMELILDAFNNNRIFVESNQCLVFFSYALAELFKRSKFIHIIRHPGDFIVSAIKKGWHMNDSIWEAGRVKLNNEEEWCNMSQIERLAWTWSVTNQFIRDFGVNIGAERFTAFKIEDIYSDRYQVHSLLNFIGFEIKISDDVMKDIQSKKVNEIGIHPDEPPNMKKVLSFPAYKDWVYADKEMIKKYIKPLSDALHYEL